MTKLTRNFIAGKMNKVVDERLVPNGEYIHAENIRMGSTENSEIGVIENTKGNLKVTSVQFNGTYLNDNARCIGAFSDDKHGTIYWFIYQPGFFNDDAAIGMIVSFDTNNGQLKYLVVSNETTVEVPLNVPIFNWSETSRIISCTKINDFFFFITEGSQPMCIDVTKSYPLPEFVDGSGYPVNRTVTTDLLVVKAPPQSAPEMKLSYVPDNGDNLQDKFMCFAYRYKYDDSQYSAISQFTNPAFNGKGFQLNPNTFLNDGMVNSINTVDLTIETGNPRVIGIDILSKNMDSNPIYLVESLDKAALSIANNTVYQYRYSDDKVSGILPDYELLRLYDNVPISAVAMTTMGNRLMYGNYVEGYDTNVNLYYYLTLKNESVNETTIDNSIGTQVSLYTNTTLELYNGLPYSSLEGKTLDINLTFKQRAGGIVMGFPDFQMSFSIPFYKNYANNQELVNDTDFLNVVGTIFNIKDMSDACIGSTMTDAFNCALPNLPNYTKYSSGVNGVKGPINVFFTGVYGIKFEFLTALYDQLVPPNRYPVHFDIITASTTLRSSTSQTSLHSNRVYDLGIVYMDDFNRSSTVLLSNNSSIKIPCADSKYRNTIWLNIPATQRAPLWATKYKYAIKSNKDACETIYSTLFFKDPASTYTYFLLSGENARKVEVGDKLTVKADTAGPRPNCTYATVIEKEAKLEGFLTIPKGDGSGDNVYVPAGVYMKINANEFSTYVGDDAVINYGNISVTELNAYNFPILAYPVSIKVGTSYEDYTIPIGSVINLKIKFSLPGKGGNCGKRIYTIEKQIISSANYGNFKEWFEGDNIINILNLGVSDLATGEPPVKNIYLSTFASTINDIPSENNYDTNYFRFYRNSTTNELFLLMSGTTSCVGANFFADKRSSINTTIDVVRSEYKIVFETQSPDALPDVYYESTYSFPCVNGIHIGNEQSQSPDSENPAIVACHDLFNCVSFGNGVESEKIQDSIIGATLKLGNRVLTSSVTKYGAVNRFADITYSGIFNPESNINGLNEFNMGLLNFKNLEQTFGSIQILDGRETDVLVLQQDKISYVLAGKNLLSDSAAGGTISSIPEVLGTQLARVEKYGISNNPESYVQFGNSRYFTDTKRGAVLQLLSGVLNNGRDQLNVISDNGMRTWFRDAFHNAPNAYNYGGYDPYMDEYVLHITDNITQSVYYMNCGTTAGFNLIAASTYNINAVIGNKFGNMTVSWKFISNPEGGKFSLAYPGGAEFDIIEDGSITFGASNQSIGYEALQLFDIAGNMTVEFTVGCPQSETMNVLYSAMYDALNADKTIHVQTGFVEGSYVSPRKTNLIPFDITTTTIEYMPNVIKGSGSTPVDGSIFEVRIKKTGSDTYTFRPFIDRVWVIEYDDVFDNLDAPMDLSQLIIDATPISMVDTSGEGLEFYGTYSYINKPNLYVIFDFRTPTLEHICYGTSVIEVCCGCTDVCPSGIIEYYIQNTSSTQSAVFRYRDGAGEIQEYTILPSGARYQTSYQMIPYAVQGTVTIEYSTCEG